MVSIYLQISTRRMVSIQKKDEKHNTKEEEKQMEADLYKQHMEDVTLDNERERHRSTIFEGNEGGIDDDK